ncbi:hypothetical protein [Salinicoccus albus]|uniref:hypothetical protein n=1 Tax=Salinicoccus albus TaxID=418756 RepID=UPI00036ABC31|nr:hypothetical protein [Salinicoccus albus]
MNDKVRMAVTLLPVILVPLFSERKRIKKHPDMQNLGSAADSACTTAKDKGTNAAKAVRNAGASTYHTGKSAAQTVSGKISDKRHEHAYKKNIRTYQKNVKEEHSLLKQFEKEKKKHRARRLKNESDVSIPKIMQPHSEPDNDEEMKSIPGSEVLQIAPPDEHEQARLVPATTEMPDDNISVAAGYAKNKQESEDITMKRNEDMTQNTGPYIEEKIKGHEFPGLESGELHKQHKHALDSKNDANIEVKETKQNDSLFEKHRKMHEDHITVIGRKSGANNELNPSRKQKKLEKKMHSHRDKNYS